MYRRRSSEGRSPLASQLQLSAFSAVLYIGIEEEQVEAIVSFIHAPPWTYCDAVTIRVGNDHAIISLGRTVHVWCRVPPNFDASDSLVVYEPAE